MQAGTASKQSGRQAWMDFHKNPSYLMAHQKIEHTFLGVLYFVILTFTCVDSNPERVSDVKKIVRWTIFRSEACRRVPRVNGAVAKRGWIFIKIHRP